MPQSAIREKESPAISLPNTLTLAFAKDGLALLPSPLLPILRTHRQSGDTGTNEHVIRKQKQGLPAGRGVGCGISQSVGYCFS